MPRNALPTKLANRTSNRLGNSGHVTLRETKNTTDQVLHKCAVGLLTYGSVITLSLPGHPVASTSMISPLTVAGAVTASAPKLDILTVFPVRLLAEGLRSTTQSISDMPSAERQHPGIHSYCKIASFGIY